jgi:hypothetical protein
MESDRFDRISRIVGAPATRRAAGRLALGSAIAGLLTHAAGEPAEAACVRRCIVRCTPRCRPAWNGRRCHRFCTRRTQHCQLQCSY